MAYGVKVKFRDDDWLWYVGSPLDKGLSRLAFKTISDAMVWCNNFNIKGTVEEFEASLYCSYQEELFDKCDFCDCWKNENL
jgi:hypothetical protein